MTDMFRLDEEHGNLVTQIHQHSQ